MVFNLVIFIMVTGDKISPYKLCIYDEKVQVQIPLGILMLQLLFIHDHKHLKLLLRLHLKFQSKRYFRR